MKSIPLQRGQIPLALSFRERPGFDLFYPGRNAGACQYVKRIAAGIGSSSVYLWGQAGSGKSHLLQAACIFASEQGHKVAYIPLAQYADFDPQLLDDLDLMQLVCIDDIDRIAGRAAWEQPLLHLYNRLRDNACAMIMTGKVNPRMLDFELEDLRSRLGWDLVFHLEPLSDEDKIEVLTRRAAARSFNLPREVAEYLVKRVRRDLHSLVMLVDALEEATLAEQRKLTVPFVKGLMEK
jgi:DnaA-homolog protein